MTLPLAATCRTALERIDQSNRRRFLLSSKPLADSRIGIDGRSFINLVDNDYLGLGRNRKLIQTFYDLLDTDNLLTMFGPGSRASRLLTGNHPGYRLLEERLAHLYGRSGCLVFNSGYHANIGILPALAGPRDLILADKRCHASLIDGFQLSRARFRRYPHNDMDRLESLLKKNHLQANQTFVVTESVFSMDGDMAPLTTLVEFKRRYGCHLYVDEAHATGVRGPSGLGLAEELGLVPEIDLLIGTFGKAWAGQGAYVICDRSVADLLVNRARSLIFTTALPPVTLAWLNFVCDHLVRAGQIRDHLWALAHWCRQRLQELGISTGGQSQIIPVYVGQSRRTMVLADTLREHGYWVAPIRPPTVPPGTARLRLSLSAALCRQELVPLPKLIAQELDSCG